MENKLFLPKSQYQKCAHTLGCHIAKFVLSIIDAVKKSLPTALQPEALT